MIKQTGSVCDIKDYTALEGGDKKSISGTAYWICQDLANMERGIALTRKQVINL